MTGRDEANPPVAMTIAGTDSGGAAGVAADLCTFASLGVHGTCVVTAVTAQDTTAVHAVAVIEPELVARQIEVVVEDLRPRAAKTGMLATRDIVELVAGKAAAGELPDLVVDPVMVASSGDRLLDEGAEASYRTLLRHALVATPNVAEASVLVGDPLDTVEDVLDAEDALRELGVPWLVVTGGDTPGGQSPGGGGAVDCVFGPYGSHILEEPRIPTPNVHGSGCTFSAAITALLACGLDPDSAIRRAKRFVTERIALSAGWRLGAGRGPVAHVFVSPPSSELPEGRHEDQPSDS
ncbi:MAG: hydroxymethylpyrimidine/phosphomethylpyrimidine kinase [Acidimicrobiales bacterium]|nr:MAG: hydroxymethylpyrimidine/phosphomethylpyrimidine kinase [Acidimicrobiales bacterium]